MKNILLTLFIVLGIAPIIKAQITCLPCDQLRMSVNVGFVLIGLSYIIQDNI